MSHAAGSTVRLSEYVHGYTGRETRRLSDQANVLDDLLHADTHYEADARVLEVGCGVGAQTRILAKRSPRAHFTSVDASAASLEVARREIGAAGIDNVGFEQRDLYELPYPDATFDHVFVCFVLEHLSEPVRALECLRRVLKPAGTITVIEGDHGSALYHPPSELAQHTIDCLVEAQRRAGGDALIGRRLFSLLRAAQFERVAVSPRVVYADPTRPTWVDGFTRNTFVAMVEGARARSIELGLTDEVRWQRGLDALRETAEGDGSFTYLFYKAVATR